MGDASDVVGRWATDPIGKHEFRWHDQVSWTGWVSDGPRRSFDPIGSAPIAGASKRFKDRRHAVNRLLMGVVAVALGVADPRLGQAIVLVARARGEGADEKLRTHLKSELPAFMHPRTIVWRDSLPRNPNGKLDRAALKLEYAA